MHQGDTQKHYSVTLNLFTVYLLKSMHKHIVNTKLVHLQKAKAIIFILNTCSPQTLYCYERRSCKISTLMLKEPFGYTEETTPPAQENGKYPAPVRYSSSEKS